MALNSNSPKQPAANTLYATSKKIHYRDLASYITIGIRSRGPLLQFSIWGHPLLLLSAYSHLQLAFAHERPVAAKFMLVAASILLGISQVTT